MDCLWLVLRPRRGLQQPARRTALYVACQCDLFLYRATLENRDPQKDRTRMSFAPMPCNKWRYALLLWGVTLSARPAESATLTTLTICVLGELNGQNRTFSYARGAAAIGLAVEYANDYILPDGYRIQTVTTDIGSTCSPKTHIIGHFMSLAERGVRCSVVLGPGCGVAAEVLFDVVEFYDVPMIGCPAANLGMTAMSDQYDLLPRVSILYENIVDVVARFLYYQNYTDATFLLDHAAGFFSDLNTYLRVHFKDAHYTIYQRSRFIDIDAITLSPEKINSTLRDASLTSRVIYLGTDGPTVRNIMIMAHNLNMTGGVYVFITIRLYPSKLWGSYDALQQDGRDVAALEAYRTLLVLVLRDVKSENIATFWQRVQVESAKRFNYSFEPGERFDPIVSHFYDGVILYATVVRDLMLTTGKLPAFRSFGQHTINYQFDSPVNGRVRLNAHADRYLEYVFVVLDRISKRFSAFMGYEPVSGTLYSRGHLNDWPGTGVLPPGTPFCGFLGDNPRCRRSTAPINQYWFQVLLPIVLLVVLVASAAWIRHKTIQARKKSKESWSIKKRELVIPLRTGKRASECADTVGVGQFLPSTTSTNGWPLTETSLMALYKGTHVQVDYLVAPIASLPHKGELELLKVMRLNCPNLRKFIGVLVGTGGLLKALVTENCSRGTLGELFATKAGSTMWDLRFSFIRDVLLGMGYLHHSKIKSHGSLTPHCCAIDGGFVVKVGGFGLSLLLPPAFLEFSENAMQAEEELQLYLYRAPELLRTRMPPGGTQKGDVYSFAIILHQALFACGPFGVRDTENTLQILSEVKSGRLPVLRPAVNLSQIDNKLCTKLDTFWHEDPAIRPTFQTVLQELDSFLPGTSDNLVSRLVTKIEHYAIGLEKAVEEQTELFMDERERTVSLLSGILPRCVADALMDGKIVEPESFTDVSVYFADAPGLMAVALSNETSPVGCIELLNGLYDACDRVMERYDVCKIDCIRDQLLIVSGLPVRNNGMHVEIIAKLALEMNARMSTFEDGTFKIHGHKLRIGLHTGSCVAGVVGAKLPKYCVFGDCVNTASRMETTGKEGFIQCTLEFKTALELRSHGQYSFLPRGKVFIKGKGMLETFWLEHAGV